MTKNSTMTMPESLDEAVHLVEMAQMSSAELPSTLEDQPAFLMGDLSLAEWMGVAPQVLERLASLGREHLEHARWTQARALFLGLFGLHPRESYFCLALGIVDYAEQQWEDALSWFDRALERNPEDPVAYAYRGEVQLERQKWDEATSDLERAIRLDPEKTHPSTARAEAILLRLKS